MINYSRSVVGGVMAPKGAHALTHATYVRLT